MKKKILLIGIVFLGIFLFTGCGKKNMFNVDEIEVGKHLVEIVDDKYVIVTNNEGSIINVTKYFFENDKLVRGEYYKKYDTEENAKIMYNALKNDTVFMQQYSSISVDKDIVTFEISDDIISIYKYVDMETFYDLQMQTYEDSLQK